MFFIGIFGIESKQKEIRIIRNISCKNCNAQSGLILIKKYSFFYIFFISIFKWNQRYYLVCNSCNSIYEISKEKGKIVEDGDDSAITYWDLKQIDKDYYDRNIQYRCRKCGKTVEPEFEYCPYCGEKRN
jgi:Zn finger protein HypA/HybF involved in hydrogenase expression